MKVPLLQCMSQPVAQSGGNISYRFLVRGVLRTSGRR
jgi:hypothetical protein